VTVAILCAALLGSLWILLVAGGAGTSTFVALAIGCVVGFGAAFLLLGRAVGKEVGEGTLVAGDLKRPMPGSQAEVIPDPETLAEAHRVALKDSEEHFQSLLHAAPDAVLLVDDERVIQLVNQRVEEMFGYGPGELVGQPVRILIPERQRDFFFQGPGRELEPGSMSQDIHMFGLRQDGSEFPMEFARAVFRTDRGVRIIAIIRDVTEREKVAGQLEQAREAAEAANRAKSTFLANMSHELRTPMNAILGYSEMLMEDAEDSGDQDTVADLRKIHQSGAHLLALINDVLDLAKIESGKMEVLAADFEVESLIDEVSATAQPLIAKNGNELNIEHYNDLGTVHQDLTKLRQSLLNLLSNAAKFTHEGTVTLKAKRDVRDGTDWLIFSVRDSGIGIRAESFAAVFDEFGQAEETTSRDYGGTGLGLPISRRFCRMLGGDLTVESELGVGSTFTICVPAVLSVADVEAPTEAEPSRTAEELTALRESGAGRTVLVIDDDAEACDLVERLLRKDGFAVVTANTGEEGLRLAHALKPAVITLDVMMPEMDGWSVLRALKADPVLRDIPVVMLTMLDDEAKGYSLGATDFLVKPVEREHLREIVSRFRAPETVSTALVIDDDPAVRETLSSALRKLDWEVESAENGREALDRFADALPALILLDLMMPVMDGFEFLIELHANPEWREIPVIVLTAKDLTAEDRRMLSGRVEQVIESEAWSHEELVGLISGLASRFRGAA
jgi:PAS domain S-box-containing protein